MKKEHIDYFFELYEKGVVPKIFSKVNSLENQESYVNPDYDENLVKNADKIYSVFFIPDYLKPTFDTDRFSSKVINQFFKGYAIFLDGFSSADAYIKHRFRSNAKGIRRRVKRLESCFQISYKTFYGEIDENEYNLLMNSLHQMLIRRFEQRNDVSQTLTQWDRYKKMYFSLINEKKASLFVAYEKEIPIIVSINHHFQGRLFSAISSYDIDYGKFSLGSVEIYKKLDWCIANDHKSYEMGMGDLSYKREWCNHIYNFKHQIIYPKKSFLAGIKANLEFIKASLKEFIFKIAYVRYKNFKAKRKKNSNLQPQFQIFPLEETKSDLEYETINYNTKSYSFLRNVVFDFLYSSIENVKDVKVFEVSKEEKSYLIVGKSKMQKVVF